MYANIFSEDSVTPQYALATKAASVVVSQPAPSETEKPTTRTTRRRCPKQGAGSPRRGAGLPGRCLRLLVPSDVGERESRRIDGRETSDVEHGGIIPVLACEGLRVTGGRGSRPGSPRLRGISIVGGRFPDRSREVSAVTPKGVGGREAEPGGEAGGRMVYAGNIVRGFGRCRNGAPRLRSWRPGAKFE